MIHVIAAIELNPGTRESFLREFRQVVPLVLAEEGCLAYGPTIDVSAGLDVQTPIRENVVTVVEQWASIEHLRKHLVAPHMDDYRARVTGYVKGLTLEVLQPV